MASRLVPKRLRGILARPAVPGLVEDSFCREGPSPRAVIELFAGQWSSRLPAPYEELTGGSAELFSDRRIAWCDEVFGGVRGMRVLELGPLEGGHTYMLDRLGVEEVVAIEANRRAYLRCLVVKELLGIPRSRFLLGDFMPYLRDAVDRGERFELCLAVGVLYHQQDPVTLLELATSVSDRLLLWTHYYDETVLAARPDNLQRFPRSFEKVTAGLSHTLHRYEYGSALGWAGFCGAGATWAAWMERGDLMTAIDHFGFTVRATTVEPDHPNGPALCLAAERRR